MPPSFDIVVPTSNVIVDTESYLALENPARIKKRLSITVCDHCYQPELDDLESDWVAHVTAPAFKAYRRQRGEAVDSFCSIGTGSGLDVLAAVEILGATRVGLTDVHEDVVVTAANNVARNRKARHPLTIEPGCGDLLAPLRPYGVRYAVIYENLPNVPLSSAEEVAADRKSSTYVPPRTECLPAWVKQQMLDLHYLALAQSREFLLPGGAVLSCLGARVPLHAFLSLGELAGYAPSFLTYGWKVQGNPEEVIRDHVRSQENGFGPFHFYRVEVLEKTFADAEPAESGKNALEIERTLLPQRLDAADAYAAFKDGERIGHTVAFLQSKLK
jgi:hypothetical protein